MTNPIPERYLDLLNFEQRVLANLVTLMPDGSPQVSPVWFDYNGTHILINSAVGRQKDKNIRRDPRVALLFVDPKDPYRYLEVRGRVVEITEDGADALIDRLAFKYQGRETYAGRNPADVRVTYKILPEKVASMG